MDFLVIFLSRLTPFRVVCRLFRAGFRAFAVLLGQPIEARSPWRFSSGSTSGDTTSTRFLRQALHSRRLLLLVDALEMRLEALEQLRNQGFETWKVENPCEEQL